MCEINDTVLYGTDGVCTITDIAVRRFGKTTMEYFVLTPVNRPGSVIYVPTQNEALRAKMRRMLTAEEIYELVQTMPDEAQADWIDSEVLRRQKFKEMLTSGDRRQLICLIKTLYQHEQSQKEKGRKLHHTDEQQMKEAEAMLYDEFAHVLQMSADEVLPFILQQIQPEEKTTAC